MLEEQPERVAAFLRTTKGLSKRKVGDYLGEREAFNVRVLEAYSSLFDFSGLSLVGAIRAFLSPFRLPGEAQKIDRIMQSFANVYCAQNEGVFRNADTAYVLGFSVIMLNTDAHSTQIKRKMSRDEFVRNNRGIDGGTDLPRELLEGLYDDISKLEIKTGQEFSDLGEAELVEWLERGSVFRKYNHARIASDRHHECRLWISNDQLLYRNLASRKAREKSIPLAYIEGLLVDATSEVFRRNGITQAQSDAALNCFSLVCGGRTLDLRAKSADDYSVWTEYFQQVVERSQLEAHARRVALRGQTREAFLESSSEVWARDILPRWSEARLEERTLMLWWEGVPSVVRHELWRRTLLADEHLSAEQRSLAYAHAVGAAQMVDSEAAERRLVREQGGSADGAPPAFSLPPEFNLYTAPESPMRQALLELMIALEVRHRVGEAAEPAPGASLLGATLLLYLEPPSAFACMQAMLRGHAIGRLHSYDGHWEWRMRAANRAISRELPVLSKHLAALGVSSETFLLEWLSTLFVSTLALDTATRVWDCYLRDGEAMLWRTVLEVLRLLAPRLLEATDAAEALGVLRAAAAAGGVTEKSLFKSLASNSVALREMLETDFSQRLPMPSAERGVSFDLWKNSLEADQEQVGGGATAGISPATGASALLRGALSGAAVLPLRLRSNSSNDSSFAGDGSVRNGTDGAESSMVQHAISRFLSLVRGRSRSAST